MKIYRVVPASFVTEERLNSTKLIGVEDIYYKMGYTSFLGKRGFHMYNNIKSSSKEEGKYFFLFFEDALFEGYNLIGYFHRLRMDKCSIIEYDVPEDIILKHIGYGDYTHGIKINHKLETFIEKSDFNSEVITTDDVSSDNKIVALTDSLIEELKYIKEYSFQFSEDMEFYARRFGSNDLDSIILDPERVTDIIKHSPFYSTFMQEKGELLKSGYITKKIIPLNMRFLSRKFNEIEEMAEYYSAMGIDFRTSKEHENFKKELLYYCEKNNEEDKPKVMSLLKERKY